MPHTLHLVRNRGLPPLAVTLRRAGAKNGSPLPKGHSKLRMLSSTHGLLEVGVEQVSPASMAFLHRTLGYKAHGGPQAYALVVVVVVVVDVVEVVVVEVVVVDVVVVLVVLVLVVVEVEVVLVEVVVDVVVVVFVDEVVVESVVVV